MLNEEKVILMTKLASYEAKEGKKNMEIGNYFRADYVAIQVLKSVGCATFTFILCYALYIFYDFDNFMQQIYKIDLVSYFRNLLILYVVVVVLYGAAAYLFSTWRYFKVRKSLKAYYQYLKKLNAIYREQRN